jgi:hypothetical protein
VAIEAANGTDQTRMDKAPEGRSPLSREQLMAIEDEGVLDKMVWRIWWAAVGRGWDWQTPGVQRSSLCSWIRPRTSRSGNSSGPHSASSDKGREVDSHCPQPAAASPAPGAPSGIHSWTVQSSNCPVQLRFP